MNCRMQAKDEMNDGGKAETVRLPDERQSEWTKTTSGRSSNSAGEECSQPCGCQGERSLSSRRSSVLLSCHRLNSKTSPAVPLSGGRKFFDTLKAEAKNEVNGIAGQTKDEWTGFR